MHAKRLPPHGRFPTQLTELVPDYLPAVLLDPFDGQPLHFRIQGDEILIYSIGPRPQDNSGQNPPTNSSESEIVIRIKSIP
jgi:hypothetical protein